ASVEHLAGEHQPPPILRPVELTVVPDSVSTFEDVANTLTRCSEVCTLLSNQRNVMKNTFFLRASLITHLVTRVIPIPLPNASPKASKECFWQATGRTMRYETQSHILRLLDLVSRHFAAASLSLKVTRSFDAVRMLTMSCLAALTDVVMRVIACDTPSPCSLHYSGRAKGPVFPFGFEMGFFAVESEGAKLNDPAFQAVRCQVLDYFVRQREGLKEDHVLFSFERSMAFSKAEFALIDQICLHMGFSRHEPWLYLSGDNPELLDVYPEIGYLRDIVYLLKAFMAPTSDALPEIKAWTPADARLHWSWKSVDEGYIVKGFGGHTLDCQAFIDDDGKASRGALAAFRKFLKGMNMSKTRAPPSGANPSNLVEKRIDNEDDVLHVQSLPDFGDRLRSRDCELMLQYLTVPYLRIPLVIKFFADPVRMQALWSEDLQEVLDASLFEPAQWQAAETKAIPTHVPAETRDHLTTPCGLLFNELLKSPKILLSSLDRMLETALELDTGRYTSTQSPLILYIFRLVVRVEGFLLFLRDEGRCRRTRGLRREDRDPRVLDELARAQGRWRRKLNSEAFPVLERWLKRAAR
ncbi:unnamed protein product, partial [Ectocarpus sp. 12 AP-2014]